MRARTPALPRQEKKLASRHDSRARKKESWAARKAPLSETEVARKNRTGASRRGEKDKILVLAAVSTAAAAATFAVSAAATVTAATAAATATIAATAAAASRAFFAGTRFIDSQGATLEVFGMEHCDSFFCIFLRGHLDESKAAGAARHAILHDVDRHYDTRLREMVLQVIFGRCEGQVTNE